jgi:two-component system, NarL family, nitrate/nitrite response regulator NarL
MRSNSLRILVADDHALMRDGLVLMIQSTWRDAQCEVASDYAEVISKLEAQPTNLWFDAVILDLRMPGMRGVDSVAIIAQRALGAPVIVCTALEDPGLVERLLKTGIRSVVNKTTGADELVRHLEDALSQGSPVSTPLSSNLNGNANSSVMHGGSAMLTNRQREILKLLHLGKPSKVIASELNVSLDTIKSHLSALYSVMGVTSRSEAIVKSQDWFL